MITTISVSSQGQITLPANVRKKFNSRTFALKVENDEIRLKSIDLDKIFEEDIDEKNFDNAAKSKKAKKLLSTLANQI